MTKHLLSFHTVFIVNENIKWLEEFLIYYKNLGVDHFYLYDNEGSVGRSGSTKDHNKYGFRTSTTSQINDQLELQYILQRYSDVITYTKWQPRNLKGEILYDQGDATRHFMSTYGHETEWAALMDLDEFLFSEPNLNLRNYLSSQPTNVSCLKVSQKKFIDRFLSTESYITQDYRCIDMPYKPEWGPKNIVRCADFVDMNPNIHIIKVKYKTVVIDPSVWRFNHYNVNPKQIEWMKEKYNKKYAINAVDDSMKRYKHLF